MKTKNQITQLHSIANSNTAQLITFTRTLKKAAQPVITVVVVHKKEWQIHAQHFIMD
jgi:hypothetical protein